MNTKAIKTALQHGANLWDDPKQGGIVKVYKGEPPASTDPADPAMEIGSISGFRFISSVSQAAALAGPMSTPFNDPLQDEDERLACAVKCMPTVAATEAWALLTNEERVQKCYEMADEFYKQRNIYKR
jgi:hypothetical protein